MAETGPKPLFDKRPRGRGKLPETGTTAFYKIAPEKESKSDAHYRKSTGNINCGNCVHMNMDGTCQVVEGKVRAKDVCDYWEGEHEPRD